MCTCNGGRETGPRWRWSLDSAGRNDYGGSRIRKAIVLLTLVAALCVPSTASAHRHPALWAWYRNSGARCVHSYEGSWTDPAPLYYGGFQMDRSFMRHWAPNRYRVAGTANHWTAAHQVAAVRRAVRAIGWGPWPNTARFCGLL